MEIRGSSFTAFIDVLTNNTYAMVIMSDPSIRKFAYLKTDPQRLDFCAHAFYCRIGCYTT